MTCLKYTLSEGEIRRGRPKGYSVISSYNYYLSNRLHKHQHKWMKEKNVLDMFVKGYLSTPGHSRHTSTLNCTN